MNNTIDVSVILVNYNSSALLINAVKSVFEHTTDVSFEIIVVDNASTDGSGVVIKEEFKDNITFIQSDENIGFGRANNLAIDVAKGTFVFLLNPDTLFLNNALKYFVDFYYTNNHKYKIGALGSILLDEKMNMSNSFGTFPTVNLILLNSLISIFYSFFPKSDSNIEVYDKDFFYVDFISGADLFISMSVIREIGCFDPRFFMYYEETDLQKRMKCLEFQRIIISGPKIVHYDGGTFNEKVKRSNNRRIMKTEGVFIYLKKYNSKLIYKLFRLVYFILRFPAVFNWRYSFEDNYKFFKRLIF